jgi:hypothetical protein
MNIASKSRMMTTVPSFILSIGRHTGHMFAYSFQVVHLRLEIPPTNIEGTNDTEV